MKNIKGKKIIIKKKEGVNFAKISGDFNLIHTCKKTGYNSQFGENIAHGVLVLFKVLIKIKLNFFLSINVKFLDSIKYNKACKITLIKKDKDLCYEIYQENTLKILLTVNKSEKEIIDKIQFSQKKKIITIPTYKNFYPYDNYIENNLLISLLQLSRYVGVIYPGKYSLINSINIIKNQNSVFKNLIQIKSKKIDKRFNLIENNLESEKYFIFFNSSIRQTLQINLEKPKKNIVNEVKHLKKNILIIGASSGLGYDLLNLFLINKKIKIISTYNKNKIKYKQRNLKKFKIDISKDLKKIFKIVKQYKPLNIYYFATPLINTKINSKPIFNEYKKYYVDIPYRIVKFSNKHKSNFFYPSTIFINNKDKSDYSNTKKLFEKKIKLLKNNLNKIYILRIDRLNTKHNLSIFHEKLPNFRKLIFNKKEIRKQIFFI